MLGKFLSSWICWTAVGGCIVFLTTHRSSKSLWKQSSTQLLPMPERWNWKIFARHDGLKDRGHFQTTCLPVKCVVMTLNVIWEPNAGHKRFYPDGEKWNWDSRTITMANGLRHTFTNFGHIVNFLCAKELIEPMRPLGELLGRKTGGFKRSPKLKSRTSIFVKISTISFMNICTMHFKKNGKS